MHPFAIALLSILLVADLYAAEEQLALKMLADVAARSDAVGLGLVRQRFVDAIPKSPPAAAARGHYYVALTDYLLSMTVGGDSARSLEASRRADASVQKAIALDPELAHAYVLRDRILYMLIQGGGMEPKDGMAAMLDASAKARKLGPGDPLVVLTEAVYRYYAPPGDHEGGRAMMRQAIDGLAAKADDDPHAAIWLPIVWNWYGTTYLGDGQMEKAREAFDSALRFRPDYAYVRRAMLPMTELAEPGTPPMSAESDWKPILTDAVGDGRWPGQHDLRSVSWRLDPASDQIWFRMDLAAALDPAHIGVNLALDLDDDQRTGNGWWAGNTAFKYDRLVTVWVGQGSDGRYRGTVGAADAADVAQGSMVSKSLGTVGFALDPSSRAILVGIDRKVLGGRDHVRMVATVGSNMSWNDTAPGQGSALLDVKR